MLRLWCVHFTWLLAHITHKTKQKQIGREGVGKGETYPAVSILQFSCVWGATRVEDCPPSVDLIVITNMIHILADPNCPNIYNTQYARYVHYPRPNVYAFVFSGWGMTGCPPLRSLIFLFVSYPVWLSQSPLQCHLYLLRHGLSLGMLQLKQGHRVDHMNVSWKSPPSPPDPLICPCLNHGLSLSLV